jgi:L-arabinokinase
MRVLELLTTVEIDITSSIDNIQTFLSCAKHDLDDEVNWLKSQCIDIVYADVPPLPILAAKVRHDEAHNKLACIPSFIVSNFTFDTIYEHFASGSSSDQEIQSIRAIAKELQDMYSKASYLIRIPGYIPMPHPEIKLMDVPLLTRSFKTPRNVIRERFKIPIDSLCVFVTLGGFDIQDLKLINLPDKWYCLIGSPSKTILPKNTERIRFFSSKDFYIPDIIEASDVVLGKLGYSTCAECNNALINLVAVSHNKPFIFVPRLLFCEQDGILSNLMIPFGRCVQMTLEDFNNGSWERFILEAFHLSIPHKKITSDGHVHIVNLIENITMNGLNI